MPPMPMPNSGGAPNPTGARTTGFVGGGMSGGEIMISKAEASALLAAETTDKEDDKRVQAESGLTLDQINRLKARADRARRAGYTLKGPGVIFKPIMPGEEEPTLLGKDVMKEKGKKKPAAAAARTTTVAKTPAMDPVNAYESAAHVRECAGDKMCSACKRAREAKRRARFDYKRSAL